MRDLPLHGLFAWNSFWLWINFYGPFRTFPHLMKIVEFRFKFCSIFPRGPINNKAAQTIAKRWTGDRPLSESMMAWFSIAYMRHPALTVLINAFYHIAVIHVRDVFLYVVDVLLWIVTCFCYIYVQFICCIGHVSNLISHTVTCVVLSNVYTFTRLNSHLSGSSLSLVVSGEFWRTRFGHVTHMCVNRVGFYWLR